MLDEYALIPDIFDPTAYSNPAFIEMCIPHLKEPLYQEAIVRDLQDGAWGRYCLANSGRLHRLAKEIVRKLGNSNRLRRFPAQSPNPPDQASEWCEESLLGHAYKPLTGIIAGHATKQMFNQEEVASIERLTGTNWWQRRSPSVTLDRKTAAYLKELDLILQQANSLMFIDPNLDPDSRNYREFHKLLTPLSQRPLPPKIEIHRSFCLGDGPARTFPTEADWKARFAPLGAVIHPLGLTAEVFLWEDFHDRYLITDIIGISVPAGFDVTGMTNDLTTWGRLGREDRDKFQRLFDPASRPPESLKWHFQC